MPKRASRSSTAVDAEAMCSVAAAAVAEGGEAPAPAAASSKAPAKGKGKASAAAAGKKEPALMPLHFEQAHWQKDPQCIVIGVDEAGRGPLAGPLVCAAAALLEPPPAGSSSTSTADPSKLLLGIKDSKQTGEEEREALFDVLVTHPNFAWGIAVVDHKAVDEINVLQASLLGMELAVAALQQKLLVLQKERMKMTAGGAAAGKKEKEDELPPSACSLLGRSMHVLVDGNKVPITLEALVNRELPPSTAEELAGMREALLTRSAASGIYCPPAALLASSSSAAGAANGGAGAMPSPSSFSSSTSSSSSFPSSSTLDPRLQLLHPYLPLSALSQYQAALPAHTVQAFAPLTGYRPPLLQCASLQALVKGDARCYSIAAASILAKVARDRLMRLLGEAFPGYGLETHKGYGTRQHMSEVVGRGPSPIHRRSYDPLKSLLAEGRWRDEADGTGRFATEEEVKEAKERRAREQKEREDSEEGKGKGQKGKAAAGGGGGKKAAAKKEAATGAGAGGEDSEAAAATAAGKKKQRLELTASAATASAPEAAASSTASKTRSGSSSRSRAATTAALSEAADPAASAESTAAALSGQRRSRTSSRGGK